MTFSLGTAKKIYHLQEHPELKEELRKKGLVRAQNFSWEESVFEVLGVYDELLDDRIL